MCGRFASARKRAELLAEFRVERDRVTEPLAPDYNVAPTKPVYAVLTRGGGSRREQAEQGDARELRVVRWGLVPSWAKDATTSGRLINARAETVDTKPAFRQAFARRRCLLPADGYFEWQPVAAEGRMRKQPYYIYRRDGGILAFAGVYEIWRDRSLPEDHDRAWLWTAAIITTRAEDGVGMIHDRMPMVIDPSLWPDWLDSGTDVADLRSLLAPAAAGGLVSHPVSATVNSVRNNGPALIEPLAGVPGGSPGPPGHPVGNGPPGTIPAGPRERSVAGDPHHHPAVAPLTLF